MRARLRRSRLFTVCRWSVENLSEIFSKSTFLYKIEIRAATILSANAPRRPSIVSSSSQTLFLSFLLWELKNVMLIDKYNTRNSVSIVIASHREFLIMRESGSKNRTPAGLPQCAATSVVILLGFSARCLFLEVDSELIEWLNIGSARTGVHSHCHWHPSDGSVAESVALWCWTK